MKCCSAYSHARANVAVEFIRPAIFAALFALLVPSVAAAQPIRVLLATHQLQTVVASEGGLVVRGENGPGAPLFAPEVTTVVSVRPQAGGLLLADALMAGPQISIRPLLDAPLSVDGRPYRGSVTIARSDDGTLSVVNELELEQYLYGVVGAEMDPAWPETALQVQAIAARSYAVSRIALREHPDFDLIAGDKDQAYGGIDSESQGPVDAVDSTRSVVLVYRYHVIAAYYSSCDGGYTADGSELEDPEPYLQSKPDPYAGESPHLAWSANVPLADFAQAFREQVGDIGDITSIKAEGADASGRVTSIAVTGTTGNIKITGEQFRKAAGRRLVKSTRIASLALAGDSILVRGSGYGHGVGLSQWGAKGMADQGLGIYAILSFYYSGTMLSRI